MHPAKLAAFRSVLLKFGFDANQASVAKKMQDVFMAADRKPLFTGEESALSSPVSQPISG